MSKLNEGTFWEVYIQVEGGRPVTPYKFLVGGEIEKCISNLKEHSNSGWSGVIVSENAIKNVFFSFENGNLVTSASPYPGCKYMTSNKFEPYK
jgi:hypothetical protein